MKQILVVIIAILSSTPAYAYRGWGWGDGWVAPALVGGVIAYDLAYPYRYPYPYPYPYPVYEQPYPIYTQPYPVYEQPAPTPPAALWYYCASAKGYYPYVRNCKEEWESVPAQPPQTAPH